MLGLGGRNPFVGLGNFQTMFADTQAANLFRTSMWNTIMFAVLVMILNLLITLPLAVMVESVAERLKGVFRFIYFLPTVSAAVAVALMWAFVFHPQQGLLNSLIRAVGLTPPRSGSPIRRHL